MVFLFLRLTDFPLGLMSSVWVQPWRGPTPPVAGPVAAQVWFRLSGREPPPPPTFCLFTPLRGWGSFLWTTMGGARRRRGTPPRLLDDPPRAAPRRAPRAGSKASPGLSPRPLRQMRAAGPAYSRVTLTVHECRRPCLRLFSAETVCFVWAERLLNSLGER